MIDFFERIARPEIASLEVPQDRSSKGISRSHLTLLLTIVGMVAAAAGAGISAWVSYYRFQAAEQQKTINEGKKAISEAGQAQLDARVNALIEEYDEDPNSHPGLDAALTKLDDNSLYRPRTREISAYERLAFDVIALRDATNALERTKLHAEAISAEQDAEKKKAETKESHARTRKAEVDAELSERVTKEAIPMFQKSIKGSSGSDSDLVGIPPARTEAERRYAEERRRNN
jgi:hypothetical protein